MILLILLLAVASGLITRMKLAQNMRSHPIEGKPMFSAVWWNWVVLWVVVFFWFSPDVTNCESRRIDWFSYFFWNSFYCVQKAPRPAPQPPLPPLANLLLTRHSVADSMEMCTLPLFFLILSFSQMQSKHARFCIKFTCHYHPLLPPPPPPPPPPSPVPLPHQRAPSLVTNPTLIWKVFWHSTFFVELHFQYYANYCQHCFINVQVNMQIAIGLNWLRMKVNWINWGSLIPWNCNFTRTKASQPARPPAAATATCTPITHPLKCDGQHEDVHLYTVFINTSIDNSDYNCPFFCI